MKLNIVAFVGLFVIAVTASGCRTHSSLEGIRQVVVYNHEEQPRTHTPVLMSPNIKGAPPAINPDSVVAFSCTKESGSVQTVELVQRTVVVEQPAPQVTQTWPMVYDNRDYYAGFNRNGFYSYPVDYPSQYPVTYLPAYQPRLEPGGYVGGGGGHHSGGHHNHN
jgi:hypothetical protein